MRPWLRALMLVVASACRQQVPTADLVARVNGEAVTKHDFDQMMARNLKRYGEAKATLPEGVVARLQESVLNLLIDEQLVAQRAKREGIDVKDEELSEKMGQHRARFRSQEAYEDYLSRSNHTEAELREELRKSLLRDRLVDKVGGPIEVDAEQIRRYYDDNQEHFVEMEQVRVHRLYLNYPKNASASHQRQVKKRGEALRATAYRERHDVEAFGRLCAKHSDAPEASRNGELGLVVTGRMPELDRALSQGLAVGQLSDVMETPHGVAIFRLDEHTPKHRRPLAEVEPSIRTSLLLHLRNERRQNVMRDIKSEAKVDALVSFESRPPAPGTAPSAPAAPARQQVGILRQAIDAASVWG